MSEPNTPSALEWIGRIAPYKPGQSVIPGCDRTIKLASNESALGPSPRAICAAQEAARSLMRYPDGGSQDLRRQLAERCGAEANWVLCANGSEEVLMNLARAYVGVGQEVLFFAQSFPLYEIIAHAVGAVPVIAPVIGFQPSVEDLLAQVTDNTAIVFLANPNNPTGVWLDSSELDQLRQGLPDNVLLVLDAAYAEYMDDLDYADGLEFVKAHPTNCITTRTFSKAYGLAGLRVGWGFGHPGLLRPLNALRGAFNVNSVAQVAALEALGDNAHLAKVVEHTRHWQAELISVAAANGFTQPDRIAGNFLFLEGSSDTGGVQALDDHLRSAGILARCMPGLNGIRITIGTEQENEVLIEALKTFHT